MLYQVYDYDVWGNNKDGFEVNNVYPALLSPSGSLFNSRNVLCRVANKEPTDREIIESLKKSGFLNKKMHYSSFTIEGEAEYTLYVTINNSRYAGRPLCELRKLSQEEIEAKLEEV